MYTFTQINSSMKRVLKVLGRIGIHSYELFENYSMSNNGRENHITL